MTNCPICNQKKAELYLEKIESVYSDKPYDISHFNAQSISHLLKTNGYKVNKIKYVGADSLFFLSSLANRLGAKNETHNLSLPKKVLVKIAPLVLRPWHYLGSEDMMVVAQKT